MLRSVARYSVSSFAHRSGAALALVAALAVAALSACDDSVPTASQETPRPDDEQASVTESQVHHVLVRQIAAALAGNPDLRRKIARDMKASPVAEGKLFLGEYLRDQGSALLTAAARKADGLALETRGREGPGSAEGSQLIESRADSLLSLVDHAPGGVEMYMPVDGHRASWDGGEDLIVATLVGDDQTAQPYGVDLDGQEVDLGRDSPPSTPTLVVVPAEGFTPEGEPRRLALRPAELSASHSPCLVDCGGGGGGGGDGVNCDLGTSGGDRGIGIQENIECLEYRDKNEPWPSGNPEFFILLSGTSDADQGDELDKRIEFPDYIWDNTSTGEPTEYSQSLALWDTDWGTRVKVKCFEDDADAEDTFTLSGTTTATAETSFAPVGTDVSFQGSFTVDLTSGDEDDACGEDYIPLRTSEGDWIEIPDGGGSSSHDYDGTSDLKWFGSGTDITA